MSNSRKIIGAFMLALCMAIATPATVPSLTNVTTVEAAKIKINKKKATLIKGQSLQLQVNNTSKMVKWTTSNKKIATVNSKGKVKAKKAGTVIITAKVGKNTYTCKLTVEQPKLSVSRLTLEKGKSENLKLNGTKQKVKWSTSNKKIATVNSKGKVTAKKPGTVKIVAKVGKKKYTCNVTVKNVSKNTNITLGQKNALAKANSYLRYMAFSYSGLIKQLEYEGFSISEATYAADNCGADWNEQSLRKAKQYLKSSAFSYSGLIEQLEFEGFTASQATYGAKNCGADWKEQAALKAKQYMKYSSFSRDSLIEQLLFEGFTQEQAEYGATSVGY